MTPRGTLIRRLQALEHTHAETLLVFVASFTGVVGEVEQITSDTRTWLRQPGETVEQLRQRAAAGAMACSTAMGPVLLEHNVRGAEALHETH